MAFSRRQAALLILAASFVPGGPAPRAQGPAAKPATIERWWVDLEKDEPDASRALLKLAATPGETTAFLKGRMAPLKVDAARVQFLLTMLGDEKDEVWKPAFEELEYFDPRLAVGLEELMPMATETPARQRMVEVLSGREAGSLGRRNVVLHDHMQGEKKYFNFYSDTYGSWWAEDKVERLVTGPGWGNPKKKWVRAVRAIVLLESFGTPEAIDLIRRMATGHPDALPTRFARAALERLGVKGE